MEYTAVFEKMDTEYVEAQNSYTHYDFVRHL
jgi:hypothetical protein